MPWNGHVKTPILTWRKEANSLRVGLQNFRGKIFARACWASLNLTRGPGCWAGRTHRFFGSSHQSLMEDSLEMILALLRQLEATVLGLKQLRGYVGQGVAQEMVEELIEEGENKLAELKRRLIQ
jgi:hypothetical protein